MNNPQRAKLFRQQYARGAKGLAGMLAKAEASGKKVGGFTAQQLREMTANFRRFSRLSDEAMHQHLVECRMRVHNRLEELRAK